MISSIVSRMCFLTAGSPGFRYTPSPAFTMSSGLPAGLFGNSGYIDLKLAAKVSRSVSRPDDRTRYGFNQAWNSIPRL